MKIIKDTKTLKKLITSYKNSGQTVGLVPTMGALHKGHISLIKAISRKVDKVIVTIFVNPTQFGKNEDFSKYPRKEDEDIKILVKEKADIVFIPQAKEIYPKGHSTVVSVEGLNKILCGEFRPVFFDGVATVVNKLFNLVQPDVAIFGEKDFQQLQVIKRMVSDLNMDVEIIAGKTIREKDGLALSSRNTYLSKYERKISAMIFANLNKAAKLIKSGDHVKSVLTNVEADLLEAGFTKVDYVEFVDAETLEPITEYQKSSRLVIAAWLGKTRLIDNIAV